MAEQARNLNLDWALYYRSLGWACMPINPGTKKPAVKWEEFEYRLPTKDEIQGWWGGVFKNCGVGIITGTISGIFVLDIDDKELEGKEGSRVLDELESKHGALPETTEAKPGGGGRHLVFRHPGLGIRIKTTKNIGPGKGLDVRGDGGYIVAAPSYHPNGNVYAWSVDAGPEQVAPADAPDWLIALLEDGLPADAGPGQHNEISRASGPLGLQGEVTDGRETYMRDTVLACLGQYIGENGALPSVQELYDLAWPQYVAHVDLTRPGRREAEMRDKCARAIRRQEEGKIRGMRTLQEAVERYRSKDRAKAPEPPGSAPETTPEVGIRLLGLDSVLSMPPPSWLVKNWLVRNGLIMVYGPPASLKSFLVLDWLLHIAYGRDWHGDRTEAGAALYVAGEGLGGLPKRLQAWLQHGGLEPTGPFFTIGQTVNMLDPKEVEAVAEAVKAKAASLGRQFAVVALDTVARTMVGGEENSALDMGKYIHNGDWLKREIGCALILVHHAGKDVARGARGSSALLGAVDTSILVERDKETGVVTLTMEKQKDAEEPPELRLTPRKIELTGHVEPVSSLVLVPEELPQTAAMSDSMTPDKARQILNVIQSAWDAGDPFSEAPNSPRYVVSMMTRQFRMSKTAAADLLGHWRDNAMVASERRSRDTATKGLRVAKWPGDRL